MHLGNRHRPLSHLATRVLLLLALAAASLTLIQCRMVGDRINGANVDVFKRKDECLAICQDQFKARNQAEDTLHQRNLAACRGNPTCIANENARHDAADAASKATREACMNGCHQQGAGTVGP